MSKPNRVIKKVTGYESARASVESWVRDFNNFNPENKAVISFSGLEAWDTKGSGEFCKAICLNSNTAKCLKSERYQIEVLW